MKERYSPVLESLPTHRQRRLALSLEQAVRLGVTTRERRVVGLKQPGDTVSSRIAGTATTCTHRSTRRVIYRTRGELHCTSQCSPGARGVSRCSSSCCCCHPQGTMSPRAVWTHRRPGFMPKPCRPATASRQRPCPPLARIPRNRSHALLDPPSPPPSVRHGLPRPRSTVM